jgi:hypothetical protein
MTAIIVLILIAAVGWSVGLSGLLRWAGIAAVALGLAVVLGVDSGQGVPLLLAGSLIWLIGKGLGPVALRPRL